jgi:dephospho-CoA kinase
MLKLGLTGSIAAGKSTVLEAFAALGVPVFSSDDAVHDLYRGEAVAPIEALFPGTIHDGVVDRAALGREVFSAPEKLATLERLVHPMVRQRQAAFLAAAEKSGAPLAVIDVPLLYESGYDYGFDRVVVVATDDATIRRRALHRPGMSVEKLEAILARQLPQAEKRRRADYVLETGGTLEQLRAAVAALAQDLGAIGQGKP